MNMAVPGFLSAIPANDTMQVRTKRAEPMHLFLLILIARGGFLPRRIQHAALAGNKILDVLDVGLHEALVLRVDLEVV